jgi:hypothetical protein
VDPGRRHRVRTRHPAQNKRSARIKRRATTRHRATTAKRAAASHVPGMPEPVASAPAMSAVSAAGEVGGDAVAVDARVGKTPPIARAQIKGQARARAPAKAVTAAIHRHPSKRRASDRPRLRLRKRPHRPEIRHRRRVPPKHRPRVPAPTTNMSCGRPVRATLSAPVRTTGSEARADASLGPS